jgi:hypothetical protein
MSSRAGGSAAGPTLRLLHLHGTVRYENSPQLPVTHVELFDAMGFSWDRSAIPEHIPRYSVERACFRFHRMLPEYVWDAGVLEGNPFTFPEVKTLLDGVTVGDHKLSDHEQILNLATSAKQLMALVKKNQFVLNKKTFTAIHALVARIEALEWGVFRGEGVETRFMPDGLRGSQGRYTPLPTIAGAVELNRTFAQGLAALQAHVPQPFEQAVVFFLFGALQQFFFDGNKRTARLMMNGVLMATGIDAISIPAARAQQFNEKMIRFYLSNEGSEMLDFLVDCHPDVTDIRAKNVGEA